MMAHETACLLEESTRGSLHTPTPARRSICERLCGRPPHDVDTSQSDWIAASALSLAKNGLVALRSARSAPSPIPAPIVERCRCEARPLLDRYLDLADKSGAVADGAAIKFCELYSRAPRENRFDLAVLHRPVVASVCEDHGAVPYATLLAAVDRLVRPVLCASGLFGEAPAEVEAVGCVLSLPGAPCQAWHPDSEHQVGLVNAFVPLVNLTEANGPTSLELGSHLRGQRSCWPPTVSPLLAAGEVLLFDWRVWHRGSANLSDEERPVAYITYAAAGVEGASYKASLPSLIAWESVWGGAGTSSQEARASGSCDSDDGSWDMFEDSF